MVSTLSMIASSSPVTAADFAELPYSPALLLDSKFDASVTDDQRFRSACEWGFDAYFEYMYERDVSGDLSVFVAKRYTWAEVVALVVECLLHPGLQDDGFEPPPPAQDAGFVLGWLSALALTEREEALKALSVGEALLLSLLPGGRVDVGA